MIVAPGPITVQTAGSHVAAEIRRRIWAGEVRPGDRLNQEDLSAELGVSRIPVREALIALEREGAIRMTPHRGAFVEPLDEDAIADHFELFGVVDGFALRRTIERATDEDRSALAAEMRRAGKVRDAREMQRLVVGVRARFHDLGGSPRFRAVARGLAGIVAGNFYEQIPGAAAVTARRLPEVGDAIDAADPAAATETYAAMMREHGDLVAEVVRARSG